MYYMFGIHPLPYDLILAGYLIFRITALPKPEPPYGFKLWGLHVPVRLSEYLHDALTSLGFWSPAGKKLFRCT